MAFFILVLLLSIPFWIAGSLSARFLPDAIPINLPVSALMAVNPVIAAVLLSYRESGAKGVRQLLERTFDCRRIEHRIWYLPMLLLWPVTVLVTWGITRLTGPTLPQAGNPFPLILLMAVAFFLSAAGEELGWQGYAFPRMRGSALRNAALLGSVWGAWHLIPLAQAHHTPAWIAAQVLGMIPFRILIVWLYNNTRQSVFAAIVFHASSNVSQFLYPRWGSHYDPLIPGLLLTAMAALVVGRWGGATLAAGRYSPT